MRKHTRTRYDMLHFPNLPTRVITPMRLHNYLSYQNFDNRLAIVIHTTTSIFFLPPFLAHSLYLSLLLSSTLLSLGSD